MKQHLFRRAVLVLAAAAALGARAGGNVEFLNITAQGETLSIALSEHPVMTYQADELHFETAARSLSVRVADVTNYSFSSVPAAIHDLQLAGQARLAGGRLFFSGLKAADAVQLFASDGRLMLQVEADDGGNAEASLAELPRGVYIVRTPNHVYKINNK